MQYGFRSPLPSFCSGFASRRLKIRPRGPGFHPHSDTAFWIIVRKSGKDRQEQRGNPKSLTLQPRPPQPHYSPIFLNEAFLLDAIDAKEKPNTSMNLDAWRKPLETA
jgi:hypothetical protein